MHENTFTDYRETHNDPLNCYIYLFTLITQAEACLRINWQWITTDLGLHLEVFTISSEPSLIVKAETLS